VGGALRQHRHERVVGSARRADQIERERDGGERVVEIVRQTAREGPDRLEALGAGHALLELSLPRHVLAGEEHPGGARGRVDHSRRSPGDEPLLAVQTPHRDLPIARVSPRERPAHGLGVLGLGVGSRADLEPRPPDEVFTGVAEQLARVAVRHGHAQVRVERDDHRLDGVEVALGLGPLLAERGRAGSLLAHVLERTHEPRDLPVPPLGPPDGADPDRSRARRHETELQVEGRPVAQRELHRCADDRTRLGSVERDGLRDRRDEVLRDLVNPASHRRPLERLRRDVEAPGTHPGELSRLLEQLLRVIARSLEGEPLEVPRGHVAARAGESERPTLRAAEHDRPGDLHPTRRLTARARHPPFEHEVVAPALDPRSERGPSPWAIFGDALAEPLVAKRRRARASLDVQVESPCHRPVGGQHVDRREGAPARLSFPHRPIIEAGRPLTTRERNAGASAPALEGYRLPVSGSPSPALRSPPG
jgi:hypothetical protein